MANLKKVAGVIVAAGFSSRADGWKLAFEIGGLSVLERCVLKMAPYCSRILVVGGARFNLLEGLLPKAKYPMVELINNPDYEQGMFASVLTGLRQVHEARFFFTPGDYPVISSNVYAMLLRQEGEIVVPSYQGVCGHPVLFRTKVVQELINDPSSYPNLREFVLSRHPQRVEVADPGILMDIDTREDYRRAVSYFNSKS